MSASQTTIACPPRVSRVALDNKTRARADGQGKKRCFYKRLPTQFQRNGFTYRQIARERNAAIYEQRSAKCVELSISYEVIRVRRREGFQIGSRFVEAAQIYPNSEAWGVDGFTFVSKDAAFAKLRVLGTGQCQGTRLCTD